MPNFREPPTPELPRIPLLKLFGNSEWVTTRGCESGQEGPKESRFASPYRQTSALETPSAKEKVRSTTHRRGKVTYPRGGMSFSHSTSLPSLAHSAAQILATFSGTGFLGGFHTTSCTLRPIPSSAHLLLPRPSYPASSHRCFRRESPLRADSNRSLSPSCSGTLALCTLAFRTNPSVPTKSVAFGPSPSCSHRSLSVLHLPRWS